MARISQLSALRLPTAKFKTAFAEKIREFSPVFDEFKADLEAEGFPSSAEWDNQTTFRVSLIAVKDARMPRASEGERDPRLLSLGFTAIVKKQEVSIFMDDKHLQQGIFFESFTSEIVKDSLIKALQAALFKVLKNK